MIRDSISLAAGVVAGAVVILGGIELGGDPITVGTVVLASGIVMLLFASIANAALDAAGVSNR